MNANEILTAAVATLDQRGRDYDQPGGERSMNRIVAAFNALTGHEMTEAEGWQFMAVLKLVRMGTAADPTDSAVDCAAYAALAGEAVVERWVPKLGDRYWTYGADKKVTSGLWCGDIRFLANWGRVFKTQGQAQAACDEYFGRTTAPSANSAPEHEPQAEGKEIEPDADGWIPWSGGKCPVSIYTWVDVKFRNGSEILEVAGSLWWDHGGRAGPTTDREIVAYRVYKPEAPAAEKDGPWRPEERGNYYYISADGDIGNMAFLPCSTWDHFNIGFGNCFRTREAAEAKRAEIFGGK